VSFKIPTTEPVSIRASIRARPDQESSVFNNRLSQPVARQQDWLEASLPAKRKQPADRPPPRLRRPASRRRTPTSDAAEREGLFLSQTQAATNLLAVCQEAVEAKRRVYVRDRSGACFMTLDPVNRRPGGPVVDVGIQFFKDNFSRVSSLVKDGVCFRVIRRGSSRPIYARRHSGYRDPLDWVIEKWRERVVTAMITARREELIQWIMVMSSGDERRAEALRREIRGLLRGLARLAIGHEPVEASELPEGDDLQTDNRPALR
jgi:hypothetical protein